jgi:hypothetical protein
MNHAAILNMRQVVTGVSGFRFRSDQNTLKPAHFRRSRAGHPQQAVHIENCWEELLLLQGEEQADAEACWAAPKPAFSAPLPPPACQATMITPQSRQYTLSTLVDVFEHAWRFQSARVLL